MSATTSKLAPSPINSVAGCAGNVKIEIKRPQDQYGLTITLNKLVVNQKLEDDQFELKFPEGVPVKTVN